MNIVTNMKILDTRPVRKEFLSLDEFLSLVEENPSIIKRSAPKAPELGKSGFGKVCVEYTKPIYKVAY